MDEVNWSGDLVSGQDVVDQQHQNLFSYINDLIRLINSGETKNNLMVEVTLDELIKYTVHHFGNEEKIMAEGKYSQLDSHKKQHQIFATKVIDYKNKYLKGEDITEELVKYLTSWLIQHIKVEDLKAMKECGA